MKRLLTGFLLFFAIGAWIPAFAWDGFDADSADLVEIIPDNVPEPGAEISVKNHDANLTETCVVESVKRNRRTIEVAASCPDGKLHTLVMEGR